MSVDEWARAAIYFCQFCLKNGLATQCSTTRDHAATAPCSAIR